VQVGRKEWWSVEAAVTVKEKRETFAKWLQKMYRYSREEYTRKRKARRLIEDYK
jgi:hypothetical protein